MARALGAAAQGARVADYTVAYDPGAGELAVEATLAAGAGANLRVDRGAEPFVRALEAAAAEAGAPFTPGARRGRVFQAEACGRGACRLRYRYALREAARTLDTLDIASDEGEVIEAPPSTFLLAPTAPDAAARVRFRVSTPEGTRFVTGVFPSPEEPGAWDISLDDLATSPYSAFGPLRVRSVDVGGAALDLAIGPGSLAVTDDDLVGYAGDAARAVAGYLGRFPLPRALVILMPARGPWVGGGRALSGGGGSVFLRVGDRAARRAFAEDWVLVHELVHLAFPSVAPEHHWAEEGLATYVEPFARVRAGLLSEGEAWRGLAEGLPNGLPGPGDRGLDRTPTWGRTYWGGALFYLLADVELRRRSGGRLGLEHALRGLLDAGLTAAARAALEDAFDAADRATGLPVLRELHEAMGTEPHPVDLGALLRELGVEVTRARVTFDDAAPLAPVRRAITWGK